MFVRVNQQVPRMDGNLRSDLVVSEVDRRVHIVNVAIPFENHCESMPAARRFKIENYTPIAEELHSQGFHITLDTLTVGALGP